MALGVAVVGSGFMGKVHSECLRQIAETEISWIISNDRKGREDLALRYKAQASNNIDRALNDPKVKIVVHALPTSERLSWLKKYVSAGKHILCEKPLARTIKEGERIARLVKNYPAKFMVGHVVRYFWEYKHARQLIKEKAIGQLGIARLSRCGQFPKGYRNWYANLEGSGGVVFDLMIHEFDYLVWLFGLPTRVFAKGLFHRQLKNMDYALAILYFPRGLLVHCEGSWTEPPGTFYTRFEFAGQKGLLEYDSRNVAAIKYSPKGTAAAKRAPGIIVPESPALYNPYMEELRHFVDCILQNKTPAIGADDGLKAVKVANAVLESIQTGQPVEIKRR